MGQIVEMEVRDLLNEKNEEGRGENLKIYPPRRVDPLGKTHLLFIKAL